MLGVILLRDAGLRFFERLLLLLEFGGFRGFLLLLRSLLLGRGRGQLGARCVREEREDQDRVSHGAGRGAPRVAPCGMSGASLASWARPARRTSYPKWSCSFAPGS